MNYCRECKQPMYVARGQVAHYHRRCRTKGRQKFGPEARMVRRLPSFVVNKPKIEVAAEVKPHSSLISRLFGK